MSRLGTLTRLAAAVLVTAAATLALPSTPAQAAYCSGGAGVSVLVDYGALGGGTSTGCGSGSPASKAFAGAGVSLKQSPRQPGFVCQVDGKPANGNCLGTNSYWGFFVSDDGKGWVYASQGVYQQAVDAGDSVALVWQSTSSRRKPGQAPAVHPTAAPTKAPTAAPSKKPSLKPSRKPSNPAAKPSTHPAAPTPTALATGAEVQGATPTPTTSHESVKPSAPSASTTTSTSTSTSSSAVAAPSDDVTPSDDATPSPTTDAATQPTADGGGGLPGWVAPGLIALLAVVAGGVAWARKAR